ncbi:MAG TPA: AbrB/MazE/SpoVT family DNA-binding domain-containing protein, partial [Terrimicrobiaceae bacterium]
MKTRITERGQVSIPAELRREMNLKPGQTIVWEKVSDRECRLIIEPRTAIKPDPAGALKFATEHGLPQRRSDEVLA